MLNNAAESYEHFSGWFRGQAGRSTRWEWTTSCRSSASITRELQFRSGFREVWWTPWIKFCLFSLRNWVMHCRMRKRRKEDGTKRNINKLSLKVSLPYFSLSLIHSFIHTRTHLNVKARSLHVGKLLWNTGFVNTTVQSVLIHVHTRYTRQCDTSGSCIVCIFSIHCTLLLKARWILGFFSLHGSYALIHSRFH